MSNVLTEFWQKHFAVLRLEFGSVHSFIHWVSCRKGLFRLVEKDSKIALNRIVSARRKYWKAKSPKTIKEGIA